MGISLTEWGTEKDNYMSEWQCTGPDDKTLNVTMQVTHWASIPQLQNL